MTLRDELPPERVLFDFRSRRSSSLEGSGKAVRARQLQVMRRRSVDDRELDPVQAVRRAGWTDDLLGFWVLWHLVGGFEALVELGWHPTTVWRKIRRFRLLTGQHPDDFQFVGITIDIDRFWSTLSAESSPQTD